MRTAHITFLLITGVCSSAADISHARDLISLERSVFQTDDKIAAEWKAIAEDRRDRIQEYLFRLGLSSTGTIQLIGVYRGDPSRTLLHFQQLDLHGSRLVWSVLVDPEDMSARVIYHTERDQVTEGFKSIATEGAK
jgi:hypothetical protein